MPGWCIGCAASRSLRRKAPDLRQRVLAPYDERYWDFGPTLAAEYLEADGLKVDHETLRQWLITAGKRSVRRRRQRHRQWREQQSLLWPDGPTGRVAPRLVRGLAGPVRAEGDGGRRDRAAVGAVLRGRDRPRASYDVFAGWVAPPGRAAPPVCGSGQHLLVRRTGQRDRTTGGP